MVKRILSTLNNGLIMLAQMNPTFIGLGSQTRAWICNLRDSQVKAQVYLRSGSSSQKILQEMGFEQSHDLKDSKVIFLLIPDAEHFNFLNEHRQQMAPKSLIIVAHGASVMEHNLPKLFPEFNFALLAIKAIASEIRYQYVNQGKLGAVYSLETISEDKKKFSKDLLDEISQKVGITSGPFPVTFEQEAKADLFSEQSLLCGLLPYAAEQAYNSLRANGIPKELAFMECWLEVKLIADAMVKMGPEDFFDLISPHALVGSELARERIFDKGQAKVIEEMRQNIWDGSFFKQVNNLDVAAVRAKIKSHWSQGELQQTYNELKDNLIPQ